MRLTLADTSRLKAGMKVLDQYLTEAIISVDKQKFSILGADPSRVTRSRFDILSASCIEYSFKDDVEPFLVKMDRFAKIIKEVGKDDMLALEIENTELKIIISGDIRTVYSIQMMELEEEQPEFAGFEPVVIAKSEQLKNALSKCKVLDPDGIMLDLKAEVLTIKSADDKDKCKVELKGDDLRVLGRPGKAKYGKDFIMNLTAGFELATDTKLDFVTDGPLRVRLEELDKFMLEVMIAPRVGDVD